MFVVSSAPVFIIGFLCGHFCRKERKTAETPDERTQSHTKQMEQKEQEESELKTNVAYGSVPRQ